MFSPIVSCKYTYSVGILEARRTEPQLRKRGAVGEPGGILNPKAGEKKFQLSRLLPSEDVKFFVEHYWVVTWDLRDQEPYLSENLPYPTVHLVIEKEQSNIFGVITGKFSV